MQTASSNRFFAHMDHLRRYAHLQHGARRLSWLSEKYQEARMTAEMERDFVRDFDENFEVLANALDPQDFDIVANYWRELSSRYYTQEQKQAFMRKLKSLREQYKHLQTQEEATKAAFAAAVQGKYLESSKWKPLWQIIPIAAFGWGMAAGASLCGGGVALCGYGMAVICGISVLMGLFNTENVYTCPVCGATSEKPVTPCGKCGAAVGQ